MWPVHCVAGTRGAEILPSSEAALREADAAGVPVRYLHKGKDARVDSYSAFASNQYTHFTELVPMLFRTERPIRNVIVCGLATDYCVCSTAIDAAKLGFRTCVVRDAVQGVAEATSIEAVRTMESYGIRVLASHKDLLYYVQGME